MSRPNKISFLVAGVALVVVLRIPAFFFGPDTDTGILAASSMMINHGLKLYAQIWDNKTPGMYYMFAAVFRLVGPSFTVLAVLGMLNFAVLSLLACHLAKILFGRTIGLYAFFIFILAAAYPVYSLDGLDTEYFVLMWVVLGSVLLLRGYATGQIKFFLLSGIALGFGFAFKQLAFWNILAVGIFALSKAVQFTKPPYCKPGNLVCLLFVMLGVVVVQVAWMMLFVREDTFRMMWYAVYEYNAHSYVGRTSMLSIRFDRDTMFRIFRSLCGVCPIWGAGCIVFLLKLRKAANDERFLFVNLMFISSLLAICSSGRFFGHYFLQAVPWVAIYAAYLLVTVLRYCKRSKINGQSTGLMRLGGYAFVISSLCLYLAAWGFYLDKYAVDNPYYRTKHLAEFLIGKMRVDDTLYVWGNPVSIYLLTGKIPLTKYTFIPSPVTKPDPRIETMKVLRRKRPTFIVKSSVYSHMEGMEDFLNACYMPVYQYKVCRFNVTADNNVCVYKIRRAAAGSN